jgi:hypothetical protein
VQFGLDLGAELSVGLQFGSACSAGALAGPVVGEISAVDAQVVVEHVPAQFAAHGRG